MGRITGVADEVVDELNAGSWSLAFTAERKIRANYKLTDLATLKVTVIPAGITFAAMDRKRKREQHSVDIIVQKRADPDDNSEVDPLIDLEEEIALGFFAKQVDTGTLRATCMQQIFVSGEDSAVEKELLEDLRTFTGVVRTVWEIQT